MVEEEYRYSFLPMMTIMINDVSYRHFSIWGKINTDIRRELPECR
jgi:hypothetical protein